MQPSSALHFGKAPPSAAWALFAGSSLALTAISAAGHSDVAAGLVEHEVAQ